MSCANGTRGLSFFSKVNILSLPNSKIYDTVSSVLFEFVQFELLQILAKFSSPLKISNT